MQLSRPYSLQTRFLSGLAFATVLAGIVFAVGFYLHMSRVLEGEIHNKAELIFAQVDAVQNYVRADLRPTMFEELPDKFVIEAMSSSFISRAVMDRVKNHGDNVGGQLLYRRVAQNARNADFEANALENEFIEYFRGNPEENAWQGYRTINDERYFILARPVRFWKNCMKCHGKKEDAPVELVNIYGNRGFGHPVDSIGGLDFVGLPVTASVGTIRDTIITYVLVFAMAAILFFSLTNLIFKRLVMNNLRLLAGTFRENFKGEKEFELLQDIERGDEIDEMVAGMQQLSSRLSETRQQLRGYAANLETMVDDRTRELARQFGSRQADVQLFVDLLAALNHSQTRPELWSNALPLIAKRFDLNQAAYICTFATQRFHSWPDPGKRPALPDNWVELLTEAKLQVEEHRAFIPVESEAGSPEGLLCLYHDKDSTFDQQDRDVLKAIGRQLGIAAENLSALDNILNQNQNLQSIFEGISDPLVLMTISGQVQAVNSAARNLTQEMAGTDNGNIVSLFCTEAGCGIEEATTQGRPLSREVNPGGDRSFLLNIYPVDEADHDNPRVIVYARENTSEKQMLAQVTQSEKMATVGKLAAGLAHEINNPLGVILCYGELLKKSISEQQQKDDVEIVIRHTKQAQKVLRNLLNFARPKASILSEPRENSTSTASIADIASSVSAVFAVQAATHNVHLCATAEDNLPLITADPQAIEHILANLLINALDEVPDNTGEVLVHSRFDAAAGQVVTTVTDNGPGFREEDLPHLYDPFFSTKDVNKGSGLGLAIVYGLMTDLGGTVHARNRTDAAGGAEFVLRFPIVSHESEQAGA